MVKQIVEFAAAFATFRRTSTNDDGAPITVDTRDEGARAWANMLLTNPQSLSLIKASDCAAIFSACVGVMYPASALQLRGMKGRNLEVTLQRPPANGSPSLGYDPRTPGCTVPRHAPHDPRRAQTVHQGRTSTPRGTVRFGPVRIPVLPPGVHTRTHSDRGSG